MINPKILYIAPLRDFSGYANAARDYVRALDLSGCELATRSLSYDGGTYSFSPREEELSKRDLQNVKIVLQHTTPNETERKDGVFNCNYFAWETDRIPEPWVAQLNKMDLVMVPCDENLKAARRSGVIVPVEKVPHTFDVSKYDVELEPYNIPGGENKFKILAICQIAKKKGLDVLLKAYFSEFRREDNTLLVLKVYFGPNDTEEHKQKMVQQIDKVRELLRINNYSNVYLVHGVLPEDAIPRLYRTCDAYCLPSRGEGWGIPHFDAMGYGLPTIAVNWGGPTEFITKDAGWLVDYSLSPCIDMPHPHPFMYTGLDNWAEPNVHQLKLAMREAYSQWSSGKDKLSSPWELRRAAGRKRAEDFSYEKIGPLMRDIIMSYYKKWSN